MKEIIYTSILEFERGKNPFDSLGLGKMREITEWIDQYVYKAQYRVNRDFTIDIIKNDFIVTGYMPKITEFPVFIKFNECFGSFLLRENVLLDLTGSPRIVHGDFMVDGNKLTTLDGCPQKVEGDFYIQKNTKKFTIEEIKKKCEISGKIKV